MRYYQAVPVCTQSLTVLLPPRAVLPPLLSSELQHIPKDRQARWAWRHLAPRAIEVSSDQHNREPSGSTGHEYRMRTYAVHNLARENTKIEVCEGKRRGHETTIRVERSWRDLYRKVVVFNYVRTQSTRNSGALNESPRARIL